MSKVLTWPITKDMVGKKVVFKANIREHVWWKFTVGELYTIVKHQKEERYGPIDDDGNMPKYNYNDTFVFEIVETELKWYQRVLNWFKGV